MPCGQLASIGYVVCRHPSQTSCSAISPACVLIRRQARRRAFGYKTIAADAMARPFGAAVFQFGKSGTTRLIFGVRSIHGLGGPTLHVRQTASRHANVNLVTVL